PTDAVRAIEQDPWRVPRIGAELWILDAGYPEISGALLFWRIQQGAIEPRRHVEHRRNRVGVVYVICADQRGIDGPRLLTGKELIQEAVGFLQVGEYLDRFPVLGA